MTTRKWTIRFLISFFLLALIVMLLNYIVDPFQHYRVSTWYKITDKKQRELTAGLAKNFPNYETAIIGSSMTENFRASFVNRELKTSTLKLSMSGMTAHEMHSVLKTVLQDNPHIKNVIIVLDIHNFSGDKTRIRTNLFPSYLYDNDPLNDIYYLLNKDTIRFTFRALKHLDETTDFDELWYTADSFEYSKKAVLRKYVPGAYGPDFASEKYKKEILQESFDYNLLPLIQNYPNVRFNILYPPYSFLVYKDMQKKGWLEEAFSFKRYLLDLDQSNLFMYDFQCLADITGNLQIYRDIAHYAPSINDYMITSIKENKHLSTASNVDACFEIIRHSANTDIEAE